MQFSSGDVRNRLFWLGFIALLLAGASGCSAVSASSNNTNSNGPVHVQLSSSSLASGVVGTAYSATLKATGGTAPYHFTVVSGTLPTGLSLSSTTGVVSGMPAASGLFSFTGQVSDSSNPAQTAQRVFPISINPLNGVAVTTLALPTGIVGTTYSTTLAASGGTYPYSWTVVSGALPAGITLSKSGTISGTPTGAGKFNFRAQVTDSSSPVQTASQPFSITLSAGVTPVAITTASLPNGIVGTAYSATLTASGGTLPYSWTILSGTLPAGLSLSQSGIISGTPTNAGQSSFTLQVADSSSPIQSANKSL
ncbi:MAG: putative Ig domain-containing protein, partial [Candidatus Sulfotelmatobacter sp.]